MPARGLLWSPNRVLPEHLSAILHGPKNEQGEKVRIPTHGQPNQVRRPNHALFDEHIFEERRFTPWIYQNADVYPRRNSKWAEGVHAKDIQGKCLLFYPVIFIVYFLELYETVVLNDERQLALECAGMAGQMWRWCWDDVEHGHNYPQDIQHTI